MWSCLPGATDVPKKPAVRSREPLTRLRVLTCALGIADASGVEALSMRRLASELGVEAMSLYNHVASKEALLDGIVELVAAEMYVPKGGGSWRTALRKRAFSAREVLRRHGWALSVIESRQNLDTTRLRACEAVLDTFYRAGFSARLAGFGLVALDSYIYGFALQEQSWPAEAAASPAAVDFSGDPRFAAQFPRIAEVARQVSGQRSPRGKPGRSADPYSAEFEFGLELLLDGFERALPKARTPSNTRKARTTRG